MKIILIVTNIIYTNDYIKLYFQRICEPNLLVWSYPHLYLQVIHNENQLDSSKTSRTSTLA